MGRWGTWGSCGCCVTTLTATASGALLSCNNIKFSGAVVTFAPTGGGTPYGTLTADTNGNYSGSVTIPSSPISVRVTATAGSSDPFAARFGTSTAITVTLTAGRITSVPTITVPAATGYHCCTFSLYYPLPDTLHLTDALNGSFVLTYNSAAGQWISPTTNLDFGGCDAQGCPAKTGVPCRYRFGCSNLILDYGVAAGTACPDPSNFSTGQGTANFPGPTTTNPFSIVGNISSAKGWYCSVSYQVTITE